MSFLAKMVVAEETKEDLLSDDCVVPQLGSKYNMKLSHRSIPDCATKQQVQSRRRGANSFGKAG